MQMSVLLQMQLELYVTKTQLESEIPNSNVQEDVETITVDNNLEVSHIHMAQLSIETA